MSQPGWYPAPEGSGSLRWWNGQHWTEHLNPEPPGSSPRSAGRPAPTRRRVPGHERADDWRRPVEATVRGQVLRADEEAVAYGGASITWARVQWVAYWAASLPDANGLPASVQWVFQAGRHPFHGGPRVEVVMEDPGVAVHDRSVQGPAGAEAKGVWLGLVGLCREFAERRLVNELVRRVRAGDSIDVAHGLIVHPGGVRGERVSLSWSAISGALLEDGRVWIRQASGAAPILYVPQQNPNAVLLPALLAALGGP